MRKSIPASQRLSITLRYLASGADFEDLKFQSCIAPRTLSGIIIETCEAINESLDNIQVRFLFKILGDGVCGIGDGVCEKGDGVCGIGDGVCEKGDGVCGIGDGVYEIGGRVFKMGAA
ncbi:hypothetical protein QTP88_003814 [Uroleucon formosanum]